MRCLHALRLLLLFSTATAEQVPVWKNPFIANEVRALKEQGAPLEAILVFLRESGISPVETMFTLYSVLGFSLSEGKRVIYESETWRDCREEEDAEIEKLLEDLDAYGESGLSEKGER